MPAYAFQIPVPHVHRDEFERLDLTNTLQLDIPCIARCGIHYSLIYPQGADAELLGRYEHEVEVNMGACGHHPGRMFFNF
jgi:hypothetical protein